MKKTVIAALLVSCATFASAASIKGSGKVVEQQRQIGDFTALRTEGAYSLIVRNGAAPSIKLSGDDNLLPLVETTVTGKQLVIAFKKDTSINMNQTIKIEVTVPKLERFSNEGAGKTEILDLKGDSFEIQYEGAGLVKATGTVKKLIVNAQGAGALELQSLKAEDARVSVQGVGAVKVFASNVLDASLEGVGSLKYYGHPKTLRKSAAGLGSVSAGD
ncbi:DUF2807 domain-containing protein [Burkholderiaceae bacterium DAT-1]|nr:DUF2807 domain-containing protein [Burkholderiaceae bacterium DAT-1]